MLQSLTIALASIFALNAPFLFGQSDKKTQAAVQDVLRAYSLPALNVSVQGDSVTLKGSVDSCRKRLLADQVVSRIHGVKTIQDSIEVLGPIVPDAQLKTQIDKIIKDRIRKLGGFGVGSIAAIVKDGAVTLSGSAAKELAGPAIDDIAGIVGVKNVIDHVLLVPRFDPSPSRSNFPHLDLPPPQ